MDTTSSLRPTCTDFRFDLQVEAALALFSQTA